METQWTPFAGLAPNEVPRDPGLTKEERQAVARMCVPGAPVWKILRAAVDSAQHLRDHIAELDLGDPDKARLARELQLRRRAALDLLAFFAASVQLPPEPKKEHPRG